MVGQPPALYNRRLARRLISLLTALSIGPGFTQAGELPKTGAAAPHLVRFGTLAPSDISYMKYAARALKSLESRSGHRVRVELYTGGVLGDEPAMMNMMLEGKIEAVFVSFLGMETLLPESMVLSLPFLFRNLEEMDHIVDRYEPRFRQLAAARGLHLLGLQTLGFNQFFSAVPLEGYDQAVGRKWWAWEGAEFLSQIAHSMGIRDFVRVPLVEVQTALGDKRVEVVAVPASAAVVLGWYPYLHHAVIVDHVAAIAATFVSLEFWESMPADVRDLATKVFVEADDKMHEWIRRDDEVALLGIAKRGAKIVRWSSAEMDKLRASSRRVWEIGTGRWFPRELLQSIQTDLEAFRLKEGGS